MSWERLPSHRRFELDTRTYAQVVAEDASLSRDVFQQLAALLKDYKLVCATFDACSCNKTKHTLDLILHSCAYADMLRWKICNAWARSLFYTLRDRVYYCLRPQSLGPRRCIRHHDRVALLNEFKPALDTWACKLRGPHRLDLFVFFYLYKHLTNDIALYIFGFL